MEDPQYFDSGNPERFIDAARLHLRLATHLMHTELSEIPEAEARANEEVEVHFLTACKIVLWLMDGGDFKAARAVQSDLTRWVLSFTEDEEDHQ
jgi:hypothetical protein